MPVLAAWVDACGPAKEVLNTRVVIQVISRGRVVRAWVRGCGLVTVEGEWRLAGGCGNAKSGACVRAVRACARGSVGVG